MILPSDVNRWSAEWRVILQERWNIMQFDGGLDKHTAYREAIKDIRRVAECKSID